MLDKLGLIVLLSLCNGFFALSEMAVIAARKSRLKQMARKSRRAAVALSLAEHPDRFLSTVQVGITVTMLITGAVIGDSLGESIGHLFHHAGLHWLARHALAIGWLAGFIVATSIQIVIGELVPKRIALIAPERLATQIAVPMLALAKLSAPFVWALNAAGTGILKLMRLERAHRQAVSEEEIRLLVAESAEQGVLDADERNMVNRVLRLGDRSVDSVMTPRTRIAWLNIEASRQDNLDILHATPFSRYPVMRGDESDIVGVIEVKRLLDTVARGDRNLFRQHLAKPLYAPETARALDLLKTFRDAQTRLALVVDEYGDISGLVTLNDLLAAVIGGASQADGGGDAIRRREDGSWLVGGRVGSDDLRELLQLDRLPHQDEHEYHTVGGMMMAVFGHIPKAGESFDWLGHRFEVFDLEGPCIDKVLVVPPADAGDHERQRAPD